MRRLVILRPEPGASATLSRARAMGLDAVALPLFTVEPVDWRAPDAAGFDALLLTSANAARLSGAELDGLRGLPAYCVGEATAAAARDLGLMVADIGASDAAALATAVPAGTRLLHLAGRDHRPVAGATTVAVYASEPIDPPPALDRLAGAVALVHSPRSGARLAELATTRRATIIAAISQAAAEACGAGWEAVAAADRPEDGALLALAADLCQKPER